MEQTEDVGSIVPVPVFVDDTGRRRKLTRRVGRVLLVGFTAYIGLLVLGFASDPRLGPIHLPTIGFPDLGLMIPPAPLALGEQTTRSPSAAGIEVSTAGASDGDVRLAPASDGQSAPSTRRSTSPGVAPTPGSAPTGRPPGSGTTTTSTSTTTTTTSIRGGSPTSSTTTPTTTAPSTPPTASPTTPGQGLVSAKGPDGSGPPGQQRRATKTTGG